MIGPTDRHPSNPYQAPRSVALDRPSGLDRPPRVLIPFPVECRLVSVAYSGLGPALASESRLGVRVDPAERPDRHVLPYVSAVALAVSAFFAAGLLLPRRPWAWIYGLS